MDSIEILKNSLTSTVQRISLIVQNYEVEIANLTTELIRVQSELEEIKKAHSNNS